jgi:hypothetical protein
MREAEEVLRNGGFIRFTWKTCTQELVAVDGTVRPLDGRTYNALTNMNLRRTATGDSDKGDLVIEWRIL